jgi:fimbrial chaperone protein
VIYLKRALLAPIYLGLALLSFSSPVLADDFSVSPTQINLDYSPSGKAPNTVLTIRNISSKTIKFQLSGGIWSQTSKDKMQITPSDDLILFPQVLTLGPGESGEARVGLTNDETINAEKSYRIVVEQLPDAQTQKAASKSFQIIVLTKFSIPIFLKPQNTTAQATVQNMINQKGHLSFELANKGTAHYLAKELTVKGLNSQGASLFQKRTDGWYVLAGATQDYGLDLPQEKCKEVSSLVLDVKTLDNNFSQTLSTPGGICK